MSTGTSHWVRCDRFRSEPGEGCPNVGPSYSDEHAARAAAEDAGWKLGPRTRDIFGMKMIYQDDLCPEHKNDK